MDNNFFQDIRPLTKQGEQEPKVGVSTMNNFDEEDLETLKELSEDKKEPVKRGGIIWFVVLIALAVLAVVLSFFFSRADVTITPKKLHIPMEDTFVFNRGSDESFEVMKVEDSVSEVVQGGTQTVNKLEKAKGSVILYNDQPIAQTLIATTRLQSPDGKIFRIPTKIVIPKAGTKPGELKVTVVADVAGPEYNIAPGRFTVPGLKGKPSYDKVYAKSTTAFTGGSKGSSLTLSGDALATKEKALSAKLEAELPLRIKEQVPEGYIYIDGAYTFKSQPIIAEKGDTPDTTKVTKQGSLSVVLIPKTLLENKLKEKVIQEKNTPATIGPTDALTAKITVPAAIDENTESVTMALSGEIEFTWTIDANKIAQSLVGTKKSSFNELMATYVDGIDRAELVIRPFWVSTVPKTINKVKIHIQ